MTPPAFLLIARKDGSSSSRRQRRMPNIVKLNAAIARWRKSGFNIWWIYAWGVAAGATDEGWVLQKHFNDGGA